MYAPTCLSNWVHALSYEQTVIKNHYAQRLFLNWGLKLSWQRKPLINDDPFFYIVRNQITFCVANITAFQRPSDLNKPLSDTGHWEQPLNQFYNVVEKMHPVLCYIHLSYNHWKLSGAIDISMVHFWLGRKFLRGQAVLGCNKSAPQSKKDGTIYESALKL